MMKATPFNCMIVGDDNLSILCAEYLLLHEHKVLCFITRSAQARYWARQKGIPCFASTNHFFKSKHSQQSCDFLFSTLPRSLPQSLIRLPTKLAIGYYNSLFVEYSDLPATSRALLNKAADYIISWHVITEQIDLSQSLAQDFYTISQQETAFSLNLKCSENAFNAFKKLIHQLILRQWQETLAEPLSLPFFLPLKEKNKDFVKTNHCQVAPEALQQIIATYAGEATPQLILFAACMTYFYRLNNYALFTISFSSLRESSFPFMLTMSPELKFNAVLSMVRSQFKPMQTDLFSQYHEEKNLPVAIIFSDDLHFEPLENSLLDVVISTNEIRIYYSKPYEASISKLLNHFYVFLSSLSQHKEKTLREHSLLTREQKDQLVVDWNNTKTVSQAHLRLMTLFEQSVEKNPDKIALIFEEESLSYTALNTRVNQLAHYLQKRVEAPNSAILLYLPRGIDIIIAMLAVLKSGNTYIPLAIETPLTRIQAILLDCEATIILTLANFREQIDSANTQSKIISLDAEQASIAAMSDENLAISFMPSHLAYVLYTSGSTGVPKGVKIKQSALVNLLLAMQKELHFNEEEVLLALAPLTFDISAVDVYLPLIFGAQFILVSDKARLDPEEIRLSIFKNKITIMQATPVTWQMLINAGWKNETKIKVLCTGEELNVQLAAQLQATNAPLWNLYGPTETTVWSIVCQLKELNPALPVPIGRPIANTEAYVLDKFLQPVPVGIPGILYIGGAGVAEGYLNKLELTEKSFIQNPFCNTPAVLYNTGDQVQWLANGDLLYLGRVDTQIKIRGFRIEIGEIEACLLQFEGILQAAVVAKTVNSFNKQLIAYLVIESKNLFNRERLILFLKTKLFDYMMPHHFVIVESLPVNSNGKIDKKALLSLSSFDSSEPLSLAIDPTIKPTTQSDYEKIIFDCLKQFHLSQSLDPETNFFNLGMNSLLLVEFSVSLSAILGQQCKIMDFFTYSTPRSLAHFLLNRQNSLAACSADNHRAQARKTREIVRRRVRV